MKFDTPPKLILPNEPNLENKEPHILCFHNPNPVAAYTNEEQVVISEALAKVPFNNSYREGKQRDIAQSLYKLLGNSLILIGVCMLTICIIGLPLELFFGINIRSTLFGGIIPNILLEGLGVYVVGIFAPLVLLLAGFLYRQIGIGLSSEKEISPQYYELVAELAEYNPQVKAHVKQLMETRGKLSESDCDYLAIYKQHTVLVEAKNEIEQYRKNYQSDEDLLKVKKKLLNKVR